MTNNVCCGIIYIYFYIGTLFILQTSNDKEEYYENRSKILFKIGKHK